MSVACIISILAACSRIAADAPPPGLVDRFCDLRQRSFPDLADDRAWERVRQYGRLPQRLASNLFEMNLEVGSPRISKSDVLRLFGVKRDSILGFSAVARATELIQPSGTFNTYELRVAWSEDLAIVARSTWDRTDLVERTAAVNIIDHASAKKYRFSTGGPVSNLSITASNRSHVCDPASSLSCAMVLDTARYRGEAWPPCDLIAIASTNDAYVLSETADVDGRECVVLACGYPSIIRVFLSINDELCPVRYEEFRYDYSSDGTIGERYLYALRHVSHLWHSDSGFAMPAEWIGGAVDIDNDEVTLVQHVCVTDLQWNTDPRPEWAMPRVDDVLAVHDEVARVSYVCSDSGPSVEEALRVAVRAGQAITPSALRSTRTEPPLADAPMLMWLAGFVGWFAALFAAFRASHRT